MKKFLPIIFVLFFLTFVSGITDLGTFKQDECVELYQICDNCSYVNLSSITYPNSSLQYLNVQMTKNEVEYNYSFCGTSALGDYFYKVCGNKDSTFQCEVIPFSITMTGYELTTSKSIMYAGLFFVLLFFFLLLLFLIGKLPSKNSTNELGEYVSIDLLKYLRSTLIFTEWMIMIAIFYLTSNLAFAYLGEQLFAKILFMFFQVSLAITPVIVIVWFVWIFALIFKDKQLKKMMERGLFPQSQPRF